MKFPFKWNLSILFEIFKRFGGALYTLAALSRAAALLTALQNSCGMETEGLFKVNQIRGGVTSRLA